MAGLGDLKFHTSRLLHLKPMPPNQGKKGHPQNTDASKSSLREQLSELFVQIPEELYSG